MKSNPNILMAVLTFSAVLLSAMLLAPSNTGVGPRDAQAVMLNAQPGYSLLTTGTPGGDEWLTIVDKATGKMIMYRLNGNNLEIMAALNFAR